MYVLSLQLTVSLFQRSESLFSCDKLCCACYMSITVDLCYNCENYFAVITPDRNFADIRTTESCSYVIEAIINSGYGEILLEHISHLTSYY